MNRRFRAYPCKFALHKFTALILLSIMPAHGSTVFVFRTSHEIVVGSDGMYSHPGMGIPGGTICKIHQSRTFFWASTGAYNDKGDIFNLPELVNRADASGGTLVLKMNALDQLAIPQIRKYLTALRASNAVFYSSLLKRKRVCTIIFLNVRANVARYVADSFTVNTLTSGNLSVIRSERNTCPGKKCPTGPSMWVDGEHEAIDSYLIQHRGAVTGTADAFVLKMIELEISAKPDSVGPPISILYIGGGMARWLARGVDCPDVQNQQK